MPFSPPFISPGSGPNTKFDRLPRGESLQARIPLRYFMFTFCCSIFSPFCAPACIRGTPPMSEMSSKSVSRHLQALYINTSWVSWKATWKCTAKCWAFLFFFLKERRNAVRCRRSHFRCVGEACEGSRLPQLWLCESHKHSEQLNRHTQLCLSHWFV